MLTPSDLLSRLPELSGKLLRLVKLDHLFALTDSNGVVQHARFSVPYRREGYSLDDNSRALVFAVKANHHWSDERLKELQTKLLSFLLLMQDGSGKLHNFLDHAQNFLDAPSVGDHLGRALWATGAVLNSPIREGMKASARLIFDRALPWARTSQSLRTKAYACLGLRERLLAEPNDINLESNLKAISTDLLAAYESNEEENWAWYEGVLTYDNPRLSQAMFAAYELLHDSKLLKVAEGTLQFLNGVETEHGVCAPIGNHGWFTRAGPKALYDQQPIEPAAMLETAAAAYRLTHAELYEEIARRALGWFFGMNTKHVIVYDGASGACYDGIGQTGLNLNQGAESTITFLLAAQEFLTCFRETE